MGAGVGSIDVLTPRPIRVGTQIAARRNYGTGKTQLTGEIRAWEEGRTGTMAIRGGSIELALATFSVEPIDANRSRVTCRARSTCAASSAGSAQRFRQSVAAR